MIDLSTMDSDEITTWMSKKNVTIESLKLRMPREEVVLEYSNGRLTIRQAGGVAGEFTGAIAMKLIQVSIGRCMG